MIRRSLLTAAAALGLAPPAHAGGEEEEASVSIAGVGLPVIADGRLRNYVFVTLRLHLARGANAAVIRNKDAFFRDALVRAAHRTPFTVADDWTRLDPRTLAAALMQASTRIAGARQVARVEIVSQSPRRRTGVRAS
ncbi:MAG: hypothetical protein KJ676_13880 [Alphaproteobacteria bacterium]|nr:hypothetical protein [Alphaproteobacteria bacterium]MBU1525858.1 hypothetical protein [Alphaproteobacteria bacterium]MBU2118424.1 hypothetical protein [Alphaproteobacteria bacterium]MBU2350467.1 hypothetical protein [Alphaproteobacteria bacterium]MBU2381057.1 hypothetical protein [Alphaproteobacteria bacterium]